MQGSIRSAQHVELSYLIGRFATEHMLRVYRLFEGDFVAGLVLATVAQHNVQEYYERTAARSQGSFDSSVDAGAHMPHLRTCNALSVASATGLPRETVRRKVRWLEQQNMLTVGPRGRLVVVRHLSRRFTDFDAGTLVRFEACARQVLAILDGKPPRRT